MKKRFSDEQIISILREAETDITKEGANKSPNAKKRLCK